MHAAVEDQAHRVVPAAPRRQPVGQHEAAGIDGQRELLLDLATDGEPRRLADLDHAARQVPVPLVGELAEQHPSVGVADEHLPDGALAGEEGVEQGAEALGLAERRVAHQPRQHDVRRRLGPVAVAALDPAQALAAQPAAGGHAQRRLVVGLDLGLDPPVPQPALPRLGQRVVGQHPHRPRGVPPPAMPLEQHPRELAHPVGPSAARPRSRPACRRPRRRTRPPSGPRRTPCASARWPPAAARASPRPPASRTSARSPRRGPPRPPRRPRAASAAASPRRRSGSAARDVGHVRNPNHRWLRRASLVRTRRADRRSVHSPGFGR